MSKLFRLLSEDPSIEHHLAVTAMLLNEDHSDVLQQIEADQYGVLHKLETFPEASSQLAMSLALAECLRKITHLIATIQPQVLVLQGDRGEMLAGAIAGAHLNTIVVHLSGGDRSGSIDDSIRNAISKFAHLHLVTCEASARRLKEMGENPERIFTTGEPGLDVVLETDFLPRSEIEREFEFAPGERYLLACVHPVTTEIQNLPSQISTTLQALKQTGLKTVFTYPNNDTGAEIIVNHLKEWEAREPWLRVVKNLGSRKFLSTLKYCSALVGNSSSGIWEAPSLKIPVVNLGTRQHMRLRAENVIDVDFEIPQIVEAIDRCFNDQSFLARVKVAKNPYGDGHASERVLQILKSASPKKIKIAKWLDA